MAVGVLGSTLNLIASAKLTPTEQLLLKGFVNEAVDPEYAAQYVSQRIKDNGDRNVEDVLLELKQDWKQLVRKFFRHEEIPPKAEALVRYRDGLHCCMVGAKDDVDMKDVTNVEPAWVMPPKIFDDEQMVSQGSLFSLLDAFLTPAKMTTTGYSMR